ncbi:MAG TPA: TonB-dependent receptor, partial [Bryobacteraceae bacterium]|nr:TonB-dependent receptor [Bryobacteraceae bacterium]
MVQVFRSAPSAHLARSLRSTARPRPADFGIILAVLFILMSVPLLAQSPVASLTGKVTDSQNAGVPQATVLARQIDTGQTFRGVSSGEGDYSIPSLPIGLYEVTVQVTGFKTFRRTDIRLEVGQRLRLDIPLELGTASETVTVTAEIGRVQTDDSSLGSVVEVQRISDLPLNGRQPFSLVNIVAGVQPTSISANGFADSSNQGFSRIRFNGGPTLGNQFFLDGSADTIPAITEISVVPMADAVQEFRVETNDLKAEFGQTSGGVVNLVTKSGTNQLHGSAYEFLRNDSLDARNAFATQRDPVTGRIKPVLRYNQFGGTAGGPVVLPKLYDGRNRTFFFFGYEQWHYRSSSVQRATVMTPLERTGDFSNTRDSLGKVIPVYDPATTTPNPNGSGYIRSVFPGNVIPSSRLDKLSLSVLNYMPQPNAQPDNAFTHVNNYVSLANSPIDQDVIDTRMDHRISDMDSVFFRYTGTLNVTKANGYGLGVADPNARYDDRTNYNAMIGETHTFSANLLNELRFGVTRQDLTFQSPGVGQNWPQQLGYSSILPQDVFPAVTISGLIGVGYQSTYPEGY